MTPALEAWVESPDSYAIAARLNAVGAEVCPHGRNPCILRCGVRLPLFGPARAWLVIGYAERLAWRVRCFGR